MTVLHNKQAQGLAQNESKLKYLRCLKVCVNTGPTSKQTTGADVLDKFSALNRSLPFKTTNVNKQGS